ncbi:MAG: HlyD family type I secretion periplasmic adaptor subunit [Stappiaceae bacterium]
MTFRRKGSDEELGPTTAGSSSTSQDKLTKLQTTPSGHLNGIRLLFEPLLSIAEPAYRRAETLVRSLFRQFRKNQVPAAEATMGPSILNSEEWYRDVPRGTKKPITMGVVIIVVTFFGFGFWAVAAPMAGAVIASGTFVATGENKIVQHLEGGIIQKIMVSEGDVVTPGQTLIKLDDTAALANLRRLLLRQVRLDAMRVRLEAESQGLEKLYLPEKLIAELEDPEVNSIVQNQALTFKARVKKLDSEVDILNSSIDALNERIMGGQTQLKAVKAQLDFYIEELTAKTKLLKSGLIRKPDVLRIQRAQANLDGEVGRLTAEIGDARERIARARAQISSQRNEMAQTAVEELQQVNAELDDVKEQILAAKDVLKRINITAPVKGVVVRMRYHTAGGVIESGRDVLELLPLQEKLIIQVRVRPTDIDNVKRGQPAQVRLTALSQRTTPMISGEVIYVSADALPDEKQNFSPSDLYVARVKLDAAEAAAVEHFRPTPGMPAEIYIKTKDRTFLDYMFEPIMDSMSRAFRES